MDNNLQENNWINSTLNVNNATDNNNNNNNIEIDSNRNILIILIYLILFLIAAIGNLTVFITLFRSRHRKSRISLMIRHLAFADLIVTFIMIPIEVCWRLTGRWMAGNIACKIIQFLRALGPYLSSNVIVCISLDRYFAVMYPLRVNVARRRGKLMLSIAWAASFIYCVPQCFVFHLSSPPNNPNFQQCVSFDSFPNKSMELFYNLSCIIFLYFIPLFGIIGAYSCILMEISRTSKTSSGKSSSSMNNNNKPNNGRLRLRRSDTRFIERARSRTLRMTVIIVVIFLICSTPYTFMTLWYMFDRVSAEKSLPDFVQDFFFMMVISNSCMNPIVYGSFAINFKKFINNNCQWINCGEKNSTDSTIPLNSVQVKRSANNNNNNNIRPSSSAT